MPAGMQAMSRIGPTALFLRLVLSSAPLAVSGGCAADDAGPATAGSPASAAAAEASEIAREARELEELARALTAEMDGARHRVVSGAVLPSDEAAALQAKMDAVSKRHDALQERIRAWEDGLHTSAADVAWPQEEVKGKR